MITCTITIGGTDYSASLISVNIRKNDVLYGKIASNEATMVLDGKVFPDKGTSATISINSETQFTGIVDHSTYSYKSQKTTISLKDKMALWKNVTVPDTALVDTDFDSVLNYLVSKIGGETNYSLESVGQPLPYIFFKDTKLIDALQKMVSSVGGSMFYDETGKLIFRAGMFSKFSPNSVSISVDDIKDLNYKEKGIVSAYTVKTSNKHETKDKRLIYTYSTSGAGTIDQKDSFTGDGSTTKFTLTHTATDTKYTVLVNGSEAVGVTKTTTDFTFSTAPASNASIQAVYHYSDSNGAIPSGGLTFWAKFDNPVAHLDDYTTATSPDQWKADSHLSIDETTYNSNFSNGININFDRFKVKINNSDSIAHNVDKFILKGYPIIEDTIEQTYKVGSDNTQQSIQNDIVHGNFWAGNLAKYMYQAQPSFEFDVPLANFPSVLSLHIGDKIIVSADTTYSGVVTDIQIGLSSNSLSGQVHVIEEPPSFTFDTDFPDTPQTPANPIHFTDGVPPVAPSILSIATGIMEGQTGYKTAYVDITINPSSSTDVISYEYGYSYDNSTWFNAGTTAANDNTYRIPSLKQGVTVYIRVRANDSEGYSSSWVTSQAITLPSTPPPAVPTGLSFTTSFSNGISHVSAYWNPNTEPDFKNYEIRWSYDQSYWRMLPSTTAHSITFDVAPNKTVWVQVRAVNSENVYSDWCQADGIISASENIPNAPTNLIYSAGYKLIWIRWDASTSENVKEYVIQRAVTTSGGSVNQSTLTWNDLATINATNYTDSGLDTSKFYAYRVAAKNFNGGLSGWTYWASDTATNPIQPNANASQVCNANEVPATPTNGHLFPGITRAIATWDMNFTPCFSYFVVEYTITQTLTDGSTQQNTGSDNITTNAWIKTLEAYMTSSVKSVDIGVKVKAVNLLGNASSELDLGSVNVPKTSGDWIDVGTITTTNISDGAISTPKLAANAVTADKIAANTITADKIAANTITGDKIAGSTITGEHLTATVDLTSKKITVGASDSSTILIGDKVVNNGTEAGILVRNGAIEVLDASNGRTYLSPQGIRQMYAVHSRQNLHVSSGENGIEIDTLTVHLPRKPDSTSTGTMTIYLNIIDSSSNTYQVWVNGSTIKSGFGGGRYTISDITVSDNGWGSEVEVVTDSIVSDEDISVILDCYVEYIYA